MFRFSEHNLVTFLGDVLAYRIKPPYINGDLIINTSLLNNIGIKEDKHYVFIKYILQEISNEGLYVLSYGGHQYGQYRVLGDGRGAYIGRLLINGEDSYDISIKGIGPTKYSRGNGRCTYEEYQNEYSRGEFLFDKGIKSTRVICAWVDSLEGCITYIRLTKSLIRIGTIEYISRLEGGDAYLDKCCEYFKYWVMGEKYINRLDLLEGVIKTYVDVCNSWEKEGFCHGRLNTDNVLLSGWAHDMSSENSIIPDGDMYSLSNQRYAIAWNIEQLGKALGLPYDSFEYMLSSIFGRKDEV